MYEKQVFKDGICRTVIEEDVTERHYSEAELHQLFELKPEGTCPTLEKANAINHDDNIIQKEEITSHKKVVRVSSHDIFYNTIEDVN